MVDMRQTIFSVAIMILSVLLVTSILLQQRGTGLGSGFGGDGNVFRTKRGIEKGLYYVTIALASLFFATALMNLLLV